MSPPDHSNAQPPAHGRFRRAWARPALCGGVLAFIVLQLMLLAPQRGTTHFPLLAICCVCPGYLHGYHPRRFHYVIIEETPGSHRLLHIYSDEAEATQYGQSPPAVGQIGTWRLHHDTFGLLAPSVERYQHAVFITWNRPATAAETATARNLLVQTLRRDEPWAHLRMFQYLAAGDGVTHRINPVGLVYDLTHALLLFFSLRGLWDWWAARRARKSQTPSDSCPHCKYALAGLDTAVCPECGGPVRLPARASTPSVL